MLCSHACSICKCLFVFALYMTSDKPFELIDEQLLQMEVVRSAGCCYMVPSVVVICKEISNVLSSCSHVRYQCCASLNCLKGCWKQLTPTVELHRMCT